MTGEQVIEFYRGRANCENFIKEQKHNFDFLHFPCKRFEACIGPSKTESMGHLKMRGQISIVSTDRLI
jgi:hypothetical protein